MSVITHCGFPAEFAVLPSHPRRHFLQPIAKAANARQDLLAGRATQVFHSCSQFARANENAVLMLIANGNAVLIANENAVLMLIANDNALLMPIANENAHRCFYLMRIYVFILLANENLC